MNGSPVPFSVPALSVDFERIYKVISNVKEDVMFKKKSVKFLLVAAVTLLSLLIVNLVNASDIKKLKVALLPDESPDVLIEKNMPLKKYLEKELAMEVELIVTTDYSVMIETMRRGKIDVGYFGPVSYVFLKSRHDAVAPIAAKKDKRGETTYRSLIIANADKNIKMLADIKGKKVAFGDPISTSSSIIPKFMLVSDGKLDINKDFESIYLGSHDAVALAVMKGHADAGGIGQHIFDSLVERGVIDPKIVKVVKISGAIPQYPFVIRTDIDKGLQERIKQAFLNLKDPEVLKPLKATGFGSISDKDYDLIRDAIKFLNIELPKKK